MLPGSDRAQIDHVLTAQNLTPLVPQLGAARSSRRDTEREHPTDRQFGRQDQLSLVRVATRDLHSVFALQRDPELVLPVADPEQDPCVFEIVRQREWDADLPALLAPPQILPRSSRRSMLDKAMALTALTIMSIRPAVEAVRAVRAARSANCAAGSRSTRTLRSRPMHPTTLRRPTRRAGSAMGSRSERTRFTLMGRRDRSKGSLRS